MNREELMGKFKAIATNPRKQLDYYLSQGKKVIGCFPLYTPDEIVYASGMIPFGIWGAECKVSKAKRYYPAYICGILQTNLELGLQGALDGLSGVLITVLCDSLKCASQNWKLGVPQIEMIPVIHPQNRQSDAGKRFLLEQYQKILCKMEEISGKKIQGEDLRAAIKIYNAHRIAMREFAELASTYPKDISAKYRNYVIKSGYFMDKAEHAKLVRELINSFKDIPAKKFRGVRVVTTGIIADSENLLEILNENKICIAADEIAHESRQFRVDVSEEEEPLESLANQFCDMYGCSTLIGGKIRRGEYIKELVQKNSAHGVIVFMTKFCDPEEYDYPMLKKTLDEAGIPTLLIEVDKQVRNYEQARTSIQTFAEILRQ